jgi:RimJ/RimL family protein N-acetyltransferase
VTGWSPPSNDELVLATGRLLLRPVVGGDADALFEHARDVDLPRHMTWSAHTAVEQTREFVAGCVVARETAQGYVWTILENARVAGLIGLDGVQRGRPGVRFDRAEIGYWLGREFRGRGLMTEAARAVLETGFGRLALHKVTSHAFVENTSSLRVLEKLGFTVVGRKREDVKKGDVWHDQLALELLAHELPAA